MDSRTFDSHDLRQVIEECIKHFLELPEVLDDVLEFEVVRVELDRDD